MKEKPYLADVQVGDKLYNFLEENEEYVVVSIECREVIVRPSSLPQGAEDPSFFEFSISADGVIESNWNVPHFLYAPVDVLDPKNLPPRPWKPKKGEWVWARLSGRLNENAPWKLVKFCQKTPSGAYLCYGQFRGTTNRYHEIAPFKGELPPGLEEDLLAHKFNSSCEIDNGDSNDAN